MEHKVIEGIQGFEAKIVEKKDTAQKLGSGLAEVFATPALVALMENVAYKSIESFLPEGHSTVGMHISVNHLKASLPGALINCTSTVTKVDGKKIVFKIEAADDDGVVGAAEHTRYIIDSKKFMERLTKAD